jgi:hypothetical protein
MTRTLGFTAFFAGLLLAGFLALPQMTIAEDDTPAKAGIDAKTAFKRIKTLVGTWKGKTVEEEKSGHEKGDQKHDAETTVIYKLTGAGSALVETQFPDSNHEMVSVYHLDGDDLRMTHYCAAGNQPRVKLDRANSTADEFVFVFDGGTNLNPEKDMHIHGVKITFDKDGGITSAWDGFMGGKKASTMKFVMTRQ